MGGCWKGEGEGQEIWDESWGRLWTSTIISDSRERNRGDQSKIKNEWGRRILGKGRESQKGWDNVKQG